MAYFYADGTRTAVQVNLIELLRDALEACVALLQAEGRLAGHADRRREVVYTAEADLASLGRLEIAMTNQARESAPVEATPAARCALAIVAAVSHEVRQEMKAVEQAMVHEVARVDATVGAELAAAHQALARLLLRHDLPEAHRELILSCRRPVPAAELRVHASGVETLIALDIPAGHLFAEPIRVQQHFEGLELPAERSTGWVLRREPRPAAERLDRYFVTELVVAPESSRMRLRAFDGGQGPGFDIELDHPDGASQPGPVR